MYWHLKCLLSRVHWCIPPRFKANLATQLSLHLWVGASIKWQGNLGWITHLLRPVHECVEDSGMDHSVAQASAWECSGLYFMLLVVSCPIPEMNAKLSAYCDVHKHVCNKFLMWTLPSSLCRWRGDSSLKLVQFLWQIRPAFLTNQPVKQI